MTVLRTLLFFFDVAVRGFLAILYLAMEVVLLLFFVAEAQDCCLQASPQSKDTMVSVAAVEQHQPQSNKSSKGGAGLGELRTMPRPTTSTDASNNANRNAPLPIFRLHTR